MMWTNILFAFLGGSGFSTIMLGLYERRERNKERARGYFLQYVLKPEFFQYLSGLMEAYYLVSDWLRFKQEGVVTTVVGGGIKKITSEDELVPIIQNMKLRAEEDGKKLRESGVFFLLPAKLRGIVEGLVNWLPESPPGIDKAALEAFRKQIRELSEVLTKSMGIEKLV